MRKYSTKELSPETLADFETLFTKPGIGDAWWCWCLHFHRAGRSTAGKQPKTRAERAVRNRRGQRDLVRQQQAHGIIVYLRGDPIGWCQYGLKEDLSHIDRSRNYKRLQLDRPSERLWRITCFVVAREHRRHGVASTALRAALDSIAEQGGGLVEAYPVVQSDQGPNYLFSGTATMFKKAGFHTIAPLSNSRTRTVLMRRIVAG